MLTRCFALCAVCRGEKWHRNDVLLCVCIGVISTKDRKIEITISINAGEIDTEIWNLSIFDPQPIKVQIFFYIHRSQSRSPKLQPTPRCIAEPVFICEEERAGETGTKNETPPCTFVRIYDQLIIFAGNKFVNLFGLSGVVFVIEPLNHLTEQKRGQVCTLHLITYTYRIWMFL